MINRSITFSFIAVIFFSSVLIAQQKERRDALSVVNRPQRISFTQDLLRRLNVPQNFIVSVFATNTGNPRMMAVAPDGAVYITRPEQKDVIVLRDNNEDGKADERKTIVQGIERVHGINIHDNKLYLAGVNELYVMDLQGGNRKKLISDLPDGGQHPNRTIGFGPEGMLYISIGSTCNACDETNREHATLLRAKPDGSRREVFAKGLRNTIGFDWHPETKQLWGMDNGSDNRGNTQPPEELNRLEQGADYGWPYCYDEKQPDEFMQAPQGTTKEEFCRNTKAPVLTYRAHSAPIEMIFYRGDQFPAQFRGDAFAALHGSWNRSEPSGYKVVRIRFEKGQPQGIDDFVTGFLVSGGDKQFGRPAGLAVAKDGSLLISDDENGVIYRVSYSARPADASR